MDPSAGTAGTTQGVKSPEGAVGTSQGTKRNDANVVTAQGALAVDGAQLVDASGNPVQLRGISTHGLSWYPDYVNLECLDAVPCSAPTPPPKDAVPDAPSSGSFPVPTPWDCFPSFSDNPFASV